LFKTHSEQRHTRAGRKKACPCESLEGSPDDGPVFQTLSRHILCGYLSGIHAIGTNDTNRKLTDLERGGYDTHCRYTWKYEALMKSEDLIRELKRAGWEHVRTRGSHHIFEKKR